VIVEWKTIELLWPEVILVAAASSIFVGGAFTRSRAYWAGAALLSYLVAAMALCYVGSPWTADSTMTGPVTIDAMSIGLRWLALAMGLVLTLAASRLVDPELASELLGSLMLVVVGVMLAASANELVLLFLGLELISIPTYMLLFLGRRDRASSEATMKYFFLSIFSSALLLYGLAMVYGLAGTTLIAGNEDARGIRELLSGMSLANNPLAGLAPLAIVLVVAGLGFKLAIAPLQFYAPDVYQGTTNLNAGLLAVAPKVAGVAGLVRLALVAMPAAADFGWQLALVLAVLTMTIGNVCALWQRNIRRLMAYSSIAHGGYLLIGLAAAAVGSDAQGGIAAMLVYVAVYAVATMGTFTALAWLGSAHREVNTVEELAGLGKSHPAAAGAIALFMFSLAGIPPLAGFWGKLTLFGSAIEVAAAPSGGNLPWWFAVLAVVGVLNAAVAAAYYLRIVAVMYFQPAATPAQAAGGTGSLAATMACAALVVLLGVLPGPVIDSAREAERTIRSRSPLAMPTALDDELGDPTPG
jgi:NADH-quinone oxidoreductase subunit N